MLQLMESFDVFAPADYAKRGWSAQFTSYALGRYGVGQCMSIDVPTKKNLRSNSSASVFMQTGFKTALTSGEVVVFQGYQGGSTQYTITYVFGANVFRLYRGNTTDTLVATSSSVPVGAGVWQALESNVVLHATTGSFTMKFNGTTICAATNLNTLATSTAILNAVGFGGGGLCTWDDFLCFDNAGLAPNNFQGDLRIDPIFPVSDGTHQDFSPSTGTVHYVLVDETVPNVVDEVHAAVTGNIDTYGMQPVAAGSQVIGVQVNMACYKDSAGVRTVAPVIRRGTADYVGTPQTPGASEAILSQIYETDPSTSSPFTLSNLNGAEFGVKLST